MLTKAKRHSARNLNVELAYRFAFHFPWDNWMFRYAALRFSSKNWTAEIVFMNWQHHDHGWAPSVCKSESAKLQREPRELKIPPGTVLRRPWWPAVECSQISCDVGHGTARGVGEQSEEAAEVPFYHLPMSCCCQICRIWSAGGLKEAAQEP